MLDNLESTEPSDIDFLFPLPLIMANYVKCPTVAPNISMQLLIALYCTTD